MKKWFENLKISKKLLISFSVMLILSIIVGAVGIIGILNIKSNDARLYEEDTLGLQYAGDAAVEFMQIRYNSLQRLNTDDHDSVKEIVNELSDNFTQMDELLTKCHETIKDSETKELLDQIQSDWDTYEPAMTKINEAALNGQEMSMDQSIVTMGNTLRDDFTTLFEKVSGTASERASDNSSEARNVVIIMLVIIVITLILSTAMTLYISGIISEPMQKFALFAEMLAVGNIEVEKVIEEKDKLLKLRKDEVGILSGSFNKIIASTIQQAHETQAIAAGDLTTAITVRSEKDVLGKALSNLVEQFHSLAVSISSSADQVDSGAKQIADSSTALAQGAAEQASSVEELTASLEEITSQTTQNAQNAQTANELTKKIKGDAETGNSQMTEMLHAMDEINVSSDNISKIIKAIEDIAFQTNILALNAAVEAARAGQYGKGFAVVAEEVRNLAAKSSEAAKETTNLIEHSIQKVEAGSKIANDTASSFGNIMADVSKATDLVGAIATASNEQASALEQINQGVMQVSQVVQTNAAAAEESAAASEELSNQADNLKTNVSVFKLNMSSSFESSINLQKQNSKESEGHKEESHAAKKSAKPNKSLSDNDFGKY